MSNKRKSLLPLTAVAALLFSGALNRQVLFSTSPTAPAPLAVPSAAPGEWENCDVSCQEVFASFLERHGPGKIDWLRVDVWQRMSMEECAFESAGRLVLGPDRCARLEMTLSAAGVNTRIGVISDGKTMAKSVRHAGAASTVTSAALSDATSSPNGGRELTNEGCCGPDTILQRFAPLLTGLKAERRAGINPGMLRATGECYSEATGFPLAPGRRVRCRLYFEEATCWLARVEWSILEGSDERTFLEMEYRNPVINEPLSEADCAREFTFRKET